MDTKLGRRQPRARFAGRLSRAATSLCPISIVVKMPLLPHLDVPAGFLGVHCRVHSRHPVVKIQSWRIARSLTNPRTTNWGRISRTCQRNTECDPWMRRKRPYSQPLRAPARPASRTIPSCLLVRVAPSSYQGRQELYPICLVSMDQELSLL